MKATGLLIGLAILIGIITAGSTVVGYGFNIYNTEATLETTYNAKVADNTSEFDNMWKKIQQVAQVPIAQKDALKDIFTSYAEARTGKGDGGSLMKWIQESVPTISTKTFENVQNIIVSSRDSWTMRQKELVDLSREYNNNLAVKPRGWFLGWMGFKVIVPKVITSSKTGEAFVSGKDDDVNLFKK